MAGVREPRGLSDTVGRVTLGGGDTRLGPLGSGPDEGGEYRSARVHTARVGRCLLTRPVRTSDDE